MHHHTRPYFVGTCWYSTRLGTTSGKFGVQAYILVGRTSASCGTQHRCTSILITLKLYCGEGPVIKRRPFFSAYRFHLVSARGLASFGILPDAVLWLALPTPPPQRQTTQVWPIKTVARSSCTQVPSQPLPVCLNGWPFSPIANVRTAAIRRCLVECTLVKQRARCLFSRALC